MITPDLVVAFLTLTFLEIVLGIDNIIFISILANRFPVDKQKKLIQIGLFLAMILRIAMLSGISLLIQIKTTLFNVNLDWFSSNISIQALILLAGGLFLLYKSTIEIFQKVEDIEEDPINKNLKSISYSRALFQIILIDIVFSFDSILTAVGMTNGIPYALWIMIISVIVSIIIMMSFAAPVSRYINKHPSLQILGLSFLLLIGFMLIAESAYLSNTTFFGSSIGRIPKGYLYFSITFSLGIEMINMRIRKRK
ncbi:MAG: TerC family protein [Flavobacteriaceae bacterium TMED147]|nr:MAG: TerC family protein [Flavobacteriaceae bacterium TMED147]